MRRRGDMVEPTVQRFRHHRNVRAARALFCALNPVLCSWRFVSRAQRNAVCAQLSQCPPRLPHPQLSTSNPSSSARRGCCWPTTHSRGLAFPVTAYSASHRGVGPSLSPFAVTFALTLPVINVPCGPPWDRADGAQHLPTRLTCPPHPFRKRASDIIVTFVPLAHYSVL